MYLAVRVYLRVCFACVGLTFLGFRVVSRSGLPRFS